MSAAPRVLDRVVLGLLALTLLVIVTGGLPPGVARPWLGRAEDVLVAAMVVAAIRHLGHPYVGQPRAPRRFGAAGVATYSLVLSFITVTRHFNLRTHAVDLALYDQMVWAIATVGAPYSSLPTCTAGAITSRSSCTSWRPCTGRYRASSPCWSCSAWRWRWARSRSGASPGGSSTTTGWPRCCFSSIPRYTASTCVTSAPRPSPSRCWRWPSGAARGPASRPRCSRSPGW